MTSITYQISVTNQNVKQINKTDISVIHTTDHFQSTVKTFLLYFENGKYYE